MNTNPHMHADTGRCYNISRPDYDTIWTAAVVWIVHANGSCSGNLSMGYGTTPAAALIHACEGTRKFPRGEHADAIEGWARDAHGWMNGMPS